MKIGILGTGTVAQVVGRKLVELDHDVVLGSRDPGQLGKKNGRPATLAEWLEGVGRRARVDSLAAATVHADLLVNALHGTATLEVLRSIGARALNGRVLLDIANELDFSKGMPPLALARDEAGGSLGERIQSAYPDLRVVKALNTMNAHVMVDPKALANGDHTLFICGNNEGAKARVRELLESFGWSDIFDLGDITAARGTELLLPIWLRLWGKLGNVPFNFKIVR